jgi:hypothetical protein
MVAWVMCARWVRNARGVRTPVRTSGNHQRPRRHVSQRHLFAGRTRRRTHVCPRPSITAGQPERLACECLHDPSFVRLRPCTQDGQAPNSFLKARLPPSPTRSAARAESPRRPEGLRKGGGSYGCRSASASRTWHQKGACASAICAASFSFGPGDVLPKVKAGNVRAPASLACAGGLTKDAGEVAQAVLG